MGINENAIRSTLAMEYVETMTSVVQAEEQEEEECYATSLHQQPWLLLFRHTNQTIDCPPTQWYTGRRLGIGCFWDKDKQGTKMLLYWQDVVGALFLQRGLVCVRECIGLPF